MSLTHFLIDLSERGLVPDFLIRAGIRNLCRKRLQQCKHDDCEANAELAEKYIADSDASPMAVLTEKANQQHYEVPAEFYRHALGKNLKYSSCYYDSNTKSLDDAEDRALALTSEHAKLENGLDILELGCGWGSLSLWMAKHFPDSQITSISNSNSQREYILGQARNRGYENLTVITADINEFTTESTYDRVVSVEMFEHVRNHRGLFSKIHDWLKPGMAAEGRIIIRIIPDIVMIPVQAVFNHKNMTFCCIKSGSNIETRVIQIDDYNNRFAAIKSGVEEGEVILLQKPEELDLTGIKALRPADKPKAQSIES